jgi:two-component system sensor histidine kinase FlrB
MDDSGEIVLATSVEASGVVLRVSDDGRGMDESVRSRLFEPFFSTGTDSQRTGLGLSSVKAFLEAHQGTIAVASVPGEGTTFTLRFPTAA